MALKQSVLNLLRVAKRIKLPCPCKGHFDYLTSQVDAALEAVGPRRRRAGPRSICDL